MDMEGLKLQKRESSEEPRSLQPEAITKNDICKNITKHILRKFNMQTESINITG